MYLAGIALVVVANGLGVLNVAWDRTDGFGLRGQATPALAFQALAASSCVSDLRIHSGGAEIPSRRNVRTGRRVISTRAYTTRKTFDNMLCDGQPRAAFARWWQWNRQYQFEFSLGFDVQTADTERDSARLAVNMRMRTAFHPRENGPYRMTVDKPTETWNVQARTTLAGGWTICRIDIPDPLTATFQKLG